MRVLIVKDEAKVPGVDHGNVFADRDPDVSSAATANQ
jgi:hypothetical protein